MNAVFEKFASENKVYTAKDGTKRIYINASELLDDCSKAESRKTIIIAEFTDGTVSAAFDGGSNAGQKARIARAIAQKLQDAEEAKADIEDYELNPRRSKSEVRDNYLKWGGNLKIWNGAEWSYNGSAIWEGAKFIQLVDSDGSGEYWASLRLPKNELATLLDAMKLEMAQIRRTSAL